jgi:hypothetical protein
MNLDPKTRTSFLKETHIPGLKNKLRTFSRQYVATPRSIKNISDLIQFTKLMKFGGSLTQQEFSSMPESFFPLEEGRRICQDFLKMYFDCGFIFGEHLKQIALFVSCVDFELYFEIYKQCMRYDKNDPEEFLAYFINTDFTLCPWLSRNDYLTYQIENKKISPEILKEYLSFDIENLMIDTCIVLEVVLLGIKLDFELYKDYFEMVMDLPMNAETMKDSISYFVDEIVRRAMFYPYYRTVIENCKFKSYAKSSLLKAREEREKSDFYKEELEWIENTINSPAFIDI